ncbi:OmpA family protein [Roseateles oligotrophus]|uniref:OmpA family protein n=1 Tax=Roseateles oligotrophus TaxID=1769250 RepID=A0ABT2YMJ7_9BURK|nr:OmpA family protein [Roseateles oligotrophus]MCV2371295.1 OmpA family protein [Roseateles oligotrophus]
MTSSKVEIAFAMKNSVQRILLLLSLCTHFAQAQAPVAVLRADQVTEAALIDALAIDGPEPVVNASTRGFRPAIVKPELVKSAKPGPGKASLLITFASNSVELSAQTKTMLDTLAGALQSDKLAGFSFHVEGHADPLGDPVLNQKLSQLRAEAVAGYLVAQQGVLPERLMAVGKGSSELLNKVQPDASENRRVTIVTRRD